MKRLITQKRHSGRPKRRPLPYPSPELRHALAPIRRRMRWLLICQMAAVGVLAAALACLVWLGISFFIPIEARALGMGVTALACLLGALALGLLWPIPWRKTIYQADAHGLAQRVETLVEQQADTGAMTQLLQRDTLARLAAFSPKEALKHAPQRRLWIATAGIALLSLVLFVLPNPQDALLAERARIREQIAQQATALEERARSLDDAHLTEQERVDLRKELAELANTLRKTDDAREALTAIDQAQRKIDTKLARSMARTMAESMPALSSSGMQAMAQAMQQSMGEMQAEAMMSELAEALDGGDMDAIEEMLTEALNEGMTMENMAAALSQAAGQASAQASASDGEGGEGMDSEALSAMASASQSGTSLRGNVATLMQLARSGISQSASGQQTAASGNQSGNSSESGNGSGSGSGQSGSGQGSGNGGQGSSGSGSGGQGQGSGVGGSSILSDRVGTYESIYDPTRLGGDAPISQVTGTHNEGDSSQLQLGPGQGDLSGSVPYNEVIGQYQAEAAQSMQRDNLPASLQTWVNRYFDALVD